MKITKAQKTHIITKLIEQAVKEADAEFGKEYKALSKAYIEANIKRVEKELKISRKMFAEGIAKGMLSRCRRFVPSVEGENFELPFKKTESLKDLMATATPNLITAYSYSWSTRLNIQVDTPIPGHVEEDKITDPLLIQAFNDMHVKACKIYESMSEMFDELTAVMASCNTDKQLEQTLPEAIAYLPLSQTNQLVPISTVVSVRKKLKTGIPV